MTSINPVCPGIFLQLLFQYQFQLGGKFTFKVLIQFYCFKNQAVFSQLLIVYTSYQLKKSIQKKIEVLQQEDFHEFNLSNFSRNFQKIKAMLEDKCNTFEIVTVHLVNEGYAMEPFIENQKTSRKQQRKYLFKKSQIQNTKKYTKISTLFQQAIQAINIIQKMLKRQSLFAKINLPFRNQRLYAKFQIENPAQERKMLTEFKILKRNKKTNSLTSKFKHRKSWIILISKQIKQNNLWKQKRKQQHIINQQSLVRTKISLENNHEKILLSNNTSELERKIACRLLIQKCFNQAYHERVEDFCNKNQFSQHQNKTRKIDLQGLDKLFKLQSNSTLVNPKKGEKKKTQLFFGQKKLKKKVFVSYDAQTRSKIMLYLKEKYSDLRNLDFPLYDKYFEILISPQSQLQKHLRNIANFNHLNRSKKSIHIQNVSMQSKKQIQQPINIQKMMQQISQTFKTENQKSVIRSNTIAKVSEQQVVFKRMQFNETSLGLYMIDFIKFDRIQSFRMQYIKIRDSLLFLLIDVLTSFAPQVRAMKQFEMNSIQVQDVQVLGEKLAIFLSKIRVKKLFLNNMGLRSSQFSKISLAILLNPQVQQIQLRNNQIDHFALKSIDQILKHNPQLKSLDLRHNEHLKHSLNLKLMQANDQRLNVS